MNNIFRYIIFQWPEVQDIMAEDGFRENSLLIDDTEKYGDSSYLVNVDWLDELNVIDDDCFDDEGNIFPSYNEIDTDNYVLYDKKTFILNNEELINHSIKAKVLNSNMFFYFIDYDWLKKNNKIK